MCCENQNSRSCLWVSHHFSCRNNVFFAIFCQRSRIFFSHMVFLMCFGHRSLFWAYLTVCLSVKAKSHWNKQMDFVPKWERCCVAWLSSKNVINVLSLGELYVALTSSIHIKINQPHKSIRSQSSLELLGLLLCCCLGVGLSKASL